MSKDYYNVHLKKRRNFYLGSMSADIRESHAEMEAHLSELSKVFNGIRTDLLLLSSRMNEYRQQTYELTVHVDNVVGQQLSHIACEIEPQLTDVEDDARYAALMERIDALENPFVRLKKMADANDRIEEAIESFQSKADAMHERLRLSEGVQTDENVVVHKKLDDVNFTIDALKKRRDALSAMRQKLYDRMVKELAKNKPTVKFNNVKLK